VIFRLINWLQFGPLAISTSILSRLVKYKPSTKKTKAYPSYARTKLNQIGNSYIKKVKSCRGKLHFYCFLPCTNQKTQIFGIKTYCSTVSLWKLPVHGCSSQTCCHSTIVSMPIWLEPEWHTEGCFSFVGGIQHIWLSFYNVVSCLH